MYILKNEKRSLVTEQLNRMERMKLAVAAMCDERSVAAVYNGLLTRIGSYKRIADAARRLKLPAPPPHNHG